VGAAGAAGAGGAPAERGARSGEDGGLPAQGLPRAAVATARLGDAAPGGGAAPLPDLARRRRGRAVPPGAGPYPGVVVCLGVVPFGVEQPLVPRLWEALARSGFAALLHWSPALRDFRLDPVDVEDIASAYEALLARPEIDPARSGLLGTCVGGAFALMAAASPRVRDRVAFVVACAPYASMWTLARDVAGYPPTGAAPHETARAVAAALQAPGARLTKRPPRRTGRAEFPPPGCPGDHLRPRLPAWSVGAASRREGHPPVSHGTHQLRPADASAGVRGLPVRASASVVRLLTPRMPPAPRKGLGGCAVRRGAPGGRHRLAVGKRPGPPIPCGASSRRSCPRRGRVHAPRPAHARTRACTVEPEPHSRGTAFHWQPVRSSSRMPSGTPPALHTALVEYRLHARHRLRRRTGGRSWEGRRADASPGPTRDPSGPPVHRGALECPCWARSRSPCGPCPRDRVTRRHPFSGGGRRRVRASGKP
jgi:hypothetical protein